jgi:hypothetical protein
MKQVISFIVILFSAAMCIAQAPKSIPFQGVAKSVDGYVFASQNASINFKIRRDSEVGAIVFEENHDVVTSPVGTMYANIGQGTLVSGSLNALANSGIPFFLEVNFSTGATTYPLGIKKLQTVPHAKYANGERFRVSATGDTLFKGGNTGFVIPGISAVND